MSKAVYHHYHPEEIAEKAKADGISPIKLRNAFRMFFNQEKELLPITHGIDSKVISWLREHFYFPTLEMLYFKEDSSGNVKAGFKTHDGHIIEAVLLDRDENHSICISTQAGCKMNCAFCATAQLGFQRNLETWEILEQVRLMYLNFFKDKKKLTHITIMGMGEPFENFDNMYRAFITLTHPFSYMLAAKNITVATAGYLPGMKKLLDKKFRPTLCISLHAPTQKLREELMPITKAYPLKELIGFIKNYPLRKNRRVSLQYLLLKGVNDKPEHAEELAALLKGLPVKINFIHYNPIDSLPYEPVDEKTRDNFVSILRANRITCIKRRSLGKDIKGACGQLGLESFKKQAVFDKF